MNTIKQIAKIRVKNNESWMKILALSFKHAPKEARAIMKDIIKCDRKISKLCKQL